MSGAIAIRAALADALTADPSVCLLGEAVDLSPATSGLRASAPGRVHLLPAADAALVGVAVGMALAGQRPVVELADAAAVIGALAQLAEAAALSGPEFPVRLVVRVPVGPGGLDPSALLCAVGGLSVVAASSSGEAAGLLRAALGSSGPVVVLEPRVACASAGDDRVDMPLCHARVLREGRDASVLAWGDGVAAALAAADALAGEGIDVDVIDLRSLSPLDVDTVRARVYETGRVVCVGGADPALVAAVEAAFLRLESPPGRADADADAVARAVRMAVHY